MAYNKKYIQEGNDVGNYLNDREDRIEVGFEDLSELKTNLKKLRVVSGVSSGGNTNFKSYPKEIWLVVMSEHSNAHSNMWIVFNSNNSIGHANPIYLGTNGTLTYHPNGVMTLNRPDAYSYSYVRIV